MAARWADIDLATGLWIKPGSAHEAEEDHIVPLSAPPGSS